MSAMQFLTGGGTMGARIQAYDWSASPLGPVETWPLSHRITLSNMLRSKLPTYLLWGPELIAFYNDACLPLRGIRPEALGRPLPQVWVETWDVVSPLVAQARRGEATYVQDLPVDIIQRKGYPETTWWNGSFSPIMNESDQVGGVLIIIHETTERVLGEQRLRFLIDLSTRLRGITEARDVMLTAAEMLGRHLRVNSAGYAEVSASGESFTVEHDWSDGTTPSFAGQYRVSDFGLLIERELKAGHAIHINDALADPRTAAEKVAASFTRAGYRAVVIVPLIKNDRQVATLFVHQAEPRHWHDDEVTLVQEVAERTWTAVLRARAETALRESEERFRQFAEHSTDVLWIQDADTMQMEYLSPAYERVWGRSPDAFKIVANGPKPSIQRTGNAHSRLPSVSCRARPSPMSTASSAPTGACATSTSSGSRFLTTIAGFGGSPALPATSRNMTGPWFMWWITTKPRAGICAFGFSRPGMR